MQLEPRRYTDARFGEYLLQIHNFADTALIHLEKSFFFPEVINGL
jgi:hypothetical protein